MTPRMISSRYELVELLGRGGMGAAWRAVDRTLDREVAVKEVAPADLVRRLALPAPHDGA
ncbi:hypothetical protein [Actinomadura sp. 21ATH]|uniref:hypothetical protein n=1 Tax=Actinomadura sp. 21ATH TaxID=1735444 RepID=UPI0035C12757